MANTTRVLVDAGDGVLEGQPAADFGAIVLTQAPVTVRPNGLAQPVSDHLSDFAGELDSARSVPGVWTYPGNGGSLASNQTIFTVPGGYTPGFVEVYIGLFWLQPTDFTATNGSTVVIPGFTFGASDVVTISVLKAGAIANTASKAAVDAKLDATSQALLALFDSLPWEPDSESALTRRGVFRQGDPTTNTYRLVVLGPKAS